jgi:fatty-acyl-CoA synthase
VVCKAGQLLDDAALRAHLQGKLARYKWPRRLVSRTALPKTALGKVQKPLLKDELLSNQ